MRGTATWFRVVHVLGLSAWLGALLLLTAMTGRLEDLVGSAHTAQAVILEGLATVERFSLVVVPVLLLTLIFGWRSRDTARRGRAAACLILGALLLVSRWVGRPYLERVRASLGWPIEALPPSDPSWSEYSWAVFVMQALVALQILILVWLLVAAVRQNPVRSRSVIEL